MSTHTSEDELEKYIVKMRREFHAHPELAFEERRTSGLIAEELKGMGLSTKTIARTGLIADISGKKGGKLVGIRADMDALPIKETNDVDYASKNEGVMHACGHDSHMAMALGTARLLSERRDELPGSVRMIFQPSEEKLPGGAIEMIKEGAIDGLDYVIGQHVSSSIPAGKVATYSGPAMANADSFNIVITGKGGHGSAPQETTDSLLAASQFIVQAQSIVSRRIAPHNPGVVTFGTFNSGYNFNIIAPFAKLTGTVRTLDNKTQETIIKELERILSGVCQASDCKYEFNYTRGYPVTVNNSEVNSVVEGAVSDVMGKEAILHMPALMGGEDFSYFLQKVPGAYYFLGVGNASKGLTSPNHSPTFNMDESVLKYGSLILLNSAISLMSR